MVQAVHAAFNIPPSTALSRSAIRDSAPIAFGMTAPDRSISMLWVDPGYRNIGLGTWVAENCLLSAHAVLKREWNHRRGTKTKEYISSSGKVGGARFMWSYADVDIKNTGFRRICERLGGVRGWTVVWLRVERDVRNGWI